MKQRQNTEERVVRSDANRLEYSICFGVEIAVREHHTFGIAGRSGCVEQNCDIVRRCLRWGEWWKFFQQGLIEALKALIGSGVDHKYSAAVHLYTGSFAGFQVSCIDEQHGRATIFQQLCNLITLERSVERNCHTPSCHHA